jgi:hypothetical protein
MWSSRDERWRRNNGIDHHIRRSFSTFIAGTIIIDLIVHHCSRIPNPQ